MTKILVKDVIGNEEAQTIYSKHTTSIAFDRIMSYIARIYSIWNFQHCITGYWTSFPQRSVFFSVKGTSNNLKMSWFCKNNYGG